MATVYKIHPAVGIARVGNSPDEFFIGPERVGERPAPPGGFKDAQCRVKRQAARFRIYAHHDDGTVEEITDAEADITWNVHLVNAKAALAARGNTESEADLTIDPGVRALDGPNQRKEFDTGEIKFSDGPVTTVHLGEIRSDDENHLVVLGGAGKSGSPPGTGIGSFFGNADWFDDVADGPVTASIRIRSTNEMPPVVGAWVIVAPPKFAPHQDSVITLYDAVLQVMADAGHVTPPTSTSYTKDIHPILQRARDTNWVEEVYGAHAWPEPVTSDALRQAIFNKLRTPSGGGGNMPWLNGAENRLTPIQYGHMERWKDGSYTNDWAGVPAPEAVVTPEGLDRAAIEACVGGSFFPGIEAGGLSPSSRPIVDPANYAEAFRLDHAVVAPGAITKTMALPWQADFNACGANWWPVPRPNDVIPQGGSGYLKWDRAVGGYEDMVDKWHTLGFVLKQGAQHLEVQRCDTPSITLITPHLDFLDVPQGPMGMVREVALPIVFEVMSTAAAVTLEYAPGGAPTHPQLFAHNTSVTVGPTTGSAIAPARLWVIFKATDVGPIPLQTVTVREPTTGKTWDVTISGNAVPRTTTAAAMVLDRSGSMSEDRGDGQTKHKSLQEAAAIFVDVMLEGDGAGLVRYNEDAQKVQDVLTLGDASPSDTNRDATKNKIDGNDFDPSGWTSIGDGIYEGRQILDAAGGFDRKALVVLTDGKENRARYIADVAAEINAHTYAIGFGTPQNTSAPALQALSGNNGGFLLVTGSIDQENRFLLEKYFLQILAGISNAEVVLDPDGVLVPGVVERIPFRLSEGDAGADVVLLTPDTGIVDFRLQTPTGQIIEPWRAAAEPGMRYVRSRGVSYFRLVLPTELIQDRFDHGGTWHALLTVGRPRTERSQDDQTGIDRTILRARLPMKHKKDLSRRRVHPAQGTTAAGHGAPALMVAAPQATAYAQKVPSVPYSLVVHSYSNVAMSADLQQSGYEPGATVRLHARVAQSGIPHAGASVWAEVRRPDGETAEVVYVEAAPGEFRATYETTAPGVYHFRVRARGESRKGYPFTRERALTAAVWRGGDHDAKTSADPGGRAGGGERPTADGLLECLTAEGGALAPHARSLLRVLGFDVERLRECLKKREHAGADTGPRDDGV